MGIRAKLILSLLCITLLPVFPVYYLVKGLLQRSLEVGYNENVESALQSASELSRDLYAQYKKEAMDCTQEIAGLKPVVTMFRLGAPLTIADNTCLARLGSARVDFFDLNGQLLNSTGAGANADYPKFYENLTKTLAHKVQPEFLDAASGSNFIVCFAPVPATGTRLGSVILSEHVSQDFRDKAGAVIRVNQVFKTLTFFDDLSEGFLLSFLAIYVPIALLAIAAGVYYSRKVTSPLLSLVDGTRQVAAGDWDYRADVHSRDEVAQLAEAFNQMIGTLKETQDQVVSLEKMAAWREIARVLAHEIKNPLTPIQLTVQQIKDKYDDSDPEYGALLGECTEIVNDEVESLRKLVREFSEFARMPKLALDRGDFDELVRDVTKLYLTENVTAELAGNLPEIDFDYEKMRQVLINLIQNGLDSIQEKGCGEIRLATSLQAGYILLEYADSGTGIAPERRDKIFEPYFSTKKSGMGLGLAVVKKIITEHGGTISLTSEEGDGANFSIRLPLPESRSDAHPTTTA